MASETKIIDYSLEYADEFKQINYAWIKKYFKIEQPDIVALENHQEKILDKGGHILFAIHENQLAGTCALIKFSDELYELAKMGVKENYQGLQIGKKLGLAIIEKARVLGAEKIFLESNRSLTPALNLYKRLGFVEVSVNDDKSDYERADIRMELTL